MSDIENYLNGLSPQQRTEYSKVREIVFDVAPEAEETISYGMPAFKYKKSPLLYFGVFKTHMSLFPASGKIIDEMSGKLEGFRTSKGTLQFTADKPIPPEVIKELLSRRLKEISD